MAIWDDYDFDRDPPDLADVLFNEDSGDFDPVAAQLWYDGVVQDDGDAYDELVEYLDYMYDIDFAEEWDWDLY